ncbi:hypothetical protein RND71_025268 [Anisodus tanguticus]|uniref:Uncharacterized protein n=1 Tax=Anisodus tanguticus TaxID=243964 RepID=A0AAE1RSQ7_9SOLA|nr:hypothetical protein RND71_025268 [Anisodus tanguticus]
MPAKFVAYANQVKLNQNHNIKEKSWIIYKSNMLNLVMTLQGQISNLRYSSMEMERRCADLIQSELVVEKLEELLLESGLDENKTEGGNLDSQPFVIVTRDTKSEIKRHEALCVASIYAHLEKSGVASSLFDEIPDKSGAYRYSLIPENVVAQHMVQQVDLYSTKSHLCLILVFS